MRELCACHWYLNVSEALGGVAAHGLDVYSMGRAAICLNRVCKVEQVLASCEVVFKLPPAMSEMIIHDALKESLRSPVFPADEKLHPGILMPRRMQSWSS